MPLKGDSSSPTKHFIKSMSEPYLAKRQSSGSKSVKAPPPIRKISSTRYAIGYHRPRSTKGGKSRSDLKQPLLDVQQSGEEEKQPLCDIREDLRQTMKLILGSWVNLLLVFVPFGIASYLAGWSAAVTFFLNFLGMIPLASILGDATECLADHLGETIGGLLNATFGNAVEVWYNFFCVFLLHEIDLIIIRA